MQGKETIELLGSFLLLYCFKSDGDAVSNGCSISCRAVLKGFSSDLIWQLRWGERVKDGLKLAKFDAFKYSVVTKGEIMLQLQIQTEIEKLYTSGLQLPPMGLYISQRFVFLERFLHPVRCF